jgi:hypothetical protein
MRKLLFFIMTTFFAANVQAIQLDGTTTATLTTNKTHLVAGQLQATERRVVLMKIKLTPKEKKILLNYDPKKFRNLSSPRSDLPSKADLGMNGVPVLDQGEHGSCVTFANTAAVDAVINKGDYVSQLCQLQLGRYLARNGYYPGGWEGTFAPMVINQIMQFGIISKQSQRAHSCGGLTEYPISSSDTTGKPMSIDEFYLYSENFNIFEHGLYWRPILNAFDRFTEKKSTDQHLDDYLNQVKQSLAIKVEDRTSRPTFAVLLPIHYCNNAGACAKHHAEFDTWALTSAIMHDPNPELGGHEMVITGYDDDATAIDNEGVVHKGLLTLRNSWSTEFGDAGNFYMTYDFFKKFIIEAQTIEFVSGGKSMDDDPAL